MNGNIKQNAETQIQIALGALLESSFDKAISDTVHTSLRKIAKRHSNEVLKACCTFAKRSEPKPPPEHLSIVLKIMEDVCQEHIISIDGDTILILLELCLDFMTHGVLYEPNVQLPASGVLVALGSKHCVQIVDGLLNRTTTGVAPHYTIPHTLGSLASANAYGVVPYLKNILGMMLPMLGSLKQDPLKQAYAYSIGKFSEAILEYTSNPEQAPDPTITVEDFHTEMGIAYDILFSVWLNSKETKLVETVLYALSSMYSVLSDDKVRQYTNKCIQVLLSMYRKHKEAQAITKCASAVISTASRVDGTLLEAQLSQILQAISDLVCITPDYAQPELLRTHSEVLRCFECLCTHYTDHTFDHILLLIKNTNDKERIKGLIILTHLTNAADVSVKNRIKDILTIIEGILMENNIRVKKVLLKAIVALAYKGFLNNTDVPSEKFLQFILKLCCKQPVLTPSDQHEFDDLKQTADNTLYMLSTSVKDLETILWNLLMKCLLSNEFTDANIIILRCLTHLAARNVNKDSCEGAFVRCIALLAIPLENFRGTFVINFLRNIKLCNYEKYKLVWDQRLPYLLRYLEQNYDTFNAKEWEDLIFDFLTKLIETINEGMFEEKLVTCIKEQLHLYISRPGEVEGGVKNQEKSFLLKCLAIISCHLNNKDLILQILEVILSNIKQDYNELQSCAEAIGICSRSNLQIVLDKLYSIRKEILLKKNSKFFGFMKDQKGEAEIERVRYMIIASYAEISNEAPSDILLRIIQNEILDFVMQELTNCKDNVIRRICLKTIGCVSDALHPNRNKLHVQLQDRDKVLQLVSAQIQLHSGPEYIELFPIVIPVLTALVKLPNILESHQRLRLLKLCFDNVFNASAIYCKLSSDSPGDVKLAPYVYMSFSKVNLLVQELLIQSISPATLDEVFTLLEPWLGRKKLEQRLPALEALRTALQTYLDNIKFAYEGPTTFGQTGTILARIIPRCTDPHKNTRKVAVECVNLMLCISGRYEGHMRDHDKLLSKALAHIQEQIDTDDMTLLSNLISDLANVISNNLPKFQMGLFVNALMDGLLDVEPLSSTGVSVVLNTIIKLKGGDLQPFINELMEKLLDELNKIKCARTRSTSLLIVLSFATHHIKPVVEIILQQPLPYDQTICSCWSILATDEALVVEIVEQLKKTLKSAVFYDEQKNADNLKIATLRPLQAICGLHQLFSAKTTKDLCKQQFPELFSLLYVALASYIQTAAPVYSNAEKKASTIPNRNAYKLNPFKICVDTFKAFLLNTDSKQAASHLMQCTEELSAFLILIPNLTESVCLENQPSLAWLIGCLGPYINSECDYQRIGVTAMFAYVLKHKVNNQSVLAEKILEMLLDVHNDPNCSVRQLSLRGLGYASEYLSTELIHRNSSSILNALMQGLDYNNSNEYDVALESMLTFSKFIAIVEPGELGQSQVTASVRIKPLLQHDNSVTREAAFYLFGDLASSIGRNDAFNEQIHGNLVTFLLHLNDEDLNVVKACKYTMRKVGPFLECAKVNTLIQEHLLEEGCLHFTQFCMDCVKLMSEDMQEYFPQLIMTCLSFFKSPWCDIRANAALLSGLLYAQTEPEFKSAVSIDTLSYRLLQLLKDGEADVRSRSVEALAYVFTTA